MTSRCYSALGLALVLLLPAGGFAQPSEVREPDRIEYKSRMYVDFDEQSLIGHVVRPEHSFLLARRKSRFKCLIRARASFLPELVKSADEAY